MSKEFGIFELISTIAALKITVGILSAAVGLFGGKKLGKNTVALVANTAAVAALTRAILSGGLGGLGIDGDGKKPRGKRSKFQRFKNMFGFGMDDVYDMNRGGKKGVQFGSKTAGGALSLAESANIGKFAKLGGLARGIPVAGQVLAAGMAVFDGVTGASDALKTFKPQTLTDSIEVGMVGAAAGITKSFAGLADMTTGLFGFDTDLAGGVTDMRDTFLKWSLDTNEKVKDMTAVLPTSRELEQAAISNRLLVDRNKVPHPSGAVIMDNSTSSNIQQNTTNLSGGMMTSVASGVDGALRWAFPHYGN